MINLMHGDCLELMRDIPDNSIDMVLTDPPYGTTDVKGWDKVVNFAKMWIEVNRVLKPDGVAVLFSSQPFTTHLITSNIKQYRYSWVWDKSRGSNFLNANCQPLKSHEDICVFSRLPCSPNKKGNSKYYPIKTGSEEYTSKLSCKSETFNGGAVKSISTRLKGKHPTTILSFKKDYGKRFHPTQKPVALLEYLIKTYTLEGEVVLDFTMGSGSTGVAAKNLGRKFIGIEMDDKYFEIAKERIENVL